MTRTGDLAKAMIDAGRPPEANDDGKASPKNRRRAPVEPYLAFPIEALPEPVGRFVRAVAGATGTDPAWGALAALVTIAGCIGNRAAVIAKRGWVEGAILWRALVGKSGSVKTSVLRLVTRALVEIFKTERATFSDEMKRFDADVARYEVTMAEWRKTQKKGLVTDPPVEPERPLERRVLVSDITIEKLASLLSENPLGLLVVVDELAGWVGGFDRYAGGRSSDLQQWLGMNDGSQLIVDRKTSGSVFVERASVSLIGTIQPRTLQRVFGEAERAAGLLARLLLTYPPERPALWTDEELPDEVAAEWCALLSGLLALPGATDESGNPRARFIGLTPSAKGMFVRWHDRHARELAKLVDDDVRACLSKLKGTCLRIALLLECTSAISTTSSTAAVSVESMRRAITVADWFKNESRRVYALLAESGEDRERRGWVEIIRRHGGVVSIRDWQRSRSLKSTTQAESELADLAAAGFGSMRISPQEGQAVQDLRAGGA